MVWAPPSTKRRQLRGGGSPIGIFHFHDLRGTAARVLHRRFAGRLIAELLGWEEAEVARLIRRYVDRHAATRASLRS